jgi:hypothetical protein
MTTGRINQVAAFPESCPLAALQQARVSLGSSTCVEEGLEGFLSE